MFVSVSSDLKDKQTFMLESVLNFSDGTYRYCGSDVAFEV